MRKLTTCVSLTLVVHMVCWIIPVRGRTRDHDFRPRISDEERLLDEIFSDYNPSARPVLNSSQTVSVSIQFSLMHIKELDIRSQMFTTTGLLMLEWHDERLVWNPRDHNRLTEVAIEARGLWTPEIALINGAENIYENYPDFRAVVTHKGDVHWEPGGVYKTMCPIDITYYPFDEQECALTFGAWSYHTQKMNLTNLNASINLDSYKKNGEWNIFDTPVERNEFSYECCPNEGFANVAFSIFLRRRHTFYILNVILPSIMTSVLLLSVFFCTPGQKVQIGVVVLLSFRIFLLNVTDNIPKTSDHIPLLGIYLTCTMALTTLSMVLTVFVLNLHHITDRPVPSWVKTIVFVYLARALGMCTSVQRQPGNMDRCAEDNEAKFATKGNFFRESYTCLHADEDNSQSGGMHDEITQGNTIELLDTPWIMRDSFRQSDPLLHNCTPLNITQPSDNALSGAHVSDSTPLESRQKSRNNHITSNVKPFEGIQDGINERCTNGNSSGSKPGTTDYAKDWKLVAEVFDRLFFWMFLLAILLTTLVLFRPLTESRKEAIY